MSKIFGSHLESGTAALALLCASAVYSGSPTAVDVNKLFAAGEVRNPFHHADGTASFPLYGLYKKAWGSSTVSKNFDARVTSDQEHLIARLRAFELGDEYLAADHSSRPRTECLRAASRFVCLLDRDLAMPEPMLNESGTAGLFWETPSVYADIEFLDSKRIAYYIEDSEGRHKGVVDFDGSNIPAVFTFFLERA